MREFLARVRFLAAASALAACDSVARPLAAFTIAIPVSPVAGQSINIRIQNTFGAIGAVTFTGGWARSV